MNGAEEGMLAEHDGWNRSFLSQRPLVSPTLSETLAALSARTLSNTLLCACREFPDSALLVSACRGWVVTTLHVTSV